MLFGQAILLYDRLAITESFTLSLHDALPILFRRHSVFQVSGHRLEPIFFGAHNRQPPAPPVFSAAKPKSGIEVGQDRKSTRLNSSHSSISYAVFCLKKKKFSLDGHNRHRKTG